jgi:hypothetical protein
VIEMSRFGRVVRGAADDQWAQFARRMREIEVIPLVVLGMTVKDRGDGYSDLHIGSFWGSRIEESASAGEREELERLLGDVSKLLGKWMQHDRERLD